MKSDLLEELGRVVVLRCRECGGLDVELIVLPPPLGIAIRCRKIWCNASGCEPNRQGDLAQPEGVGEAVTEECLECGSAICPCVWEKIQLKDKLFAEKGFEVADLQEQRDTAWGRIMGLEAELKLSVGSVCTITRKVDSLEIRWKPSDLGRYRYIEARVEGLSLELNRRDEFIASLDAALKKVTLERDHLMTLICLASQEE